MSAHHQPAPSLRQTLIAVLALALAMISVTSGAAIAKGMFAAIGPQGTVALRNGFGALMLLAFWRPWRGGAVSTAQLRLLLIYGVNLGLMNLLYYLALQRLPLGLAVAIEFIGPFSLALFHSRRPADLLWLGFAVAGLLLLLPWGAGSLAVDPLGAAYALVAGAAWACYIVFGQKAGALLPSGRVVAIGTVIAAAVTLPIGWATAGGALWAPGVLAVGLVVALFSSAIPYSFDMIAMKRLPTRTFGVLMSVEPAIAALSGFLVLGEQLTLRQQIAIACVVIASFGSTASSGTVVTAAPEL